MCYLDYKQEWDNTPGLLQTLPLYALRAWRDVQREPVWFAISWQSDRGPFDAVMDKCDTGDFSVREWKKWWETIVGDLGDGHTGAVYVDRLLQLQRYKNIVQAIERVEAREVAELLEGRAA